MIGSIFIEVFRGGRAIEVKKISVRNVFLRVFFSLRASYCSLPAKKIPCLAVARVSYAKEKPATSDH